MIAHNLWVYIIKKIIISIFHVILINMQILYKNDSNSISIANAMVGIESSFDRNLLRMKTTLHRIQWGPSLAVSALPS